MTDTIATLFSGFEGVGVGARAAGIDHLWGVEWSAPLAGVAERNGFTTIVGDVRSQDYATLPRTRRLHASPVCKNASVAKTDGGEAPEDLETAQAVCRAIVALQPEIFTLENVRGYRSFAAYGAILDTLRGNGYGVAEAVLNSADYGVPQTRERLIVRAVKGQDRPAMPVPTHARPDKIAPMFDTRLPWIGWYEAIADLIDGLPDSAFAPWQLERLPGVLRESVLVAGENGSNDKVHRLADSPTFVLSSSAKGAYRAFIVSNAATEYSDGLRAADEPMLSVTTQHGGRLRAVLVGSQNAGQEWGDGVVYGDEPVMTLSTRQKPRAAVHGRVVRMTPRCLARFQSFPDDYWLPEKVSLACEGIGNAVPPKLAQAIHEVSL